MQVIAIAAASIKARRCVRGRPDVAGGSRVQSLSLKLMAAPRGP